MSEAYLSTLWYRVAGLKPRLRAHVRVSRHRYRGRSWYVLQDVAGGRVHRFTPAAYMLIARMDGTRSIDALWQDLALSLDEEAPSQDEVIRLLSSLHSNDLIQYAGTPDVADLLERHNRQSRQVLKQNLTNPMSFRLRLWDPDAFLARSLPFVRWLTGWAGFAIWAVVVLAGAITAGMHWDRLTTDVAGQVLSAQNLLITLVTYPVLKALHELAHGWLAKARGVEVRETGVMFLVLFPVPYVDVSGSSALADKWARAAIAAGGIMVETFAAAVAVMVWSGAESGFTAALAYNVMMIGGLSTLLVNGNPLLKFDGYFVLTDLIEIPNLAPRATRFWGHLAERYLFGSRASKEEVATPGERVWFVVYAPAAFVYRLSVTFGIALYVATKFFVVGMVLAAWSVFNAALLPVLKALHHVVTAPRLRKNRKRALGVTFGGIAVAGLLLALVPLPLRTEAQGVVWLPEEAWLRARTSGFVTDLQVARGTEVAADAPVARLEEPTLAARIEALRWRVEEMRRRLSLAEVSARDQAEAARLQLADAQAELARETARAGDLTLRAPVAGRFEPVLDLASLPGRWLAEGDVLGHVLPARADRIRLVVTQDDIALVRGGVRGVRFALDGWIEDPHDTRILREVPSAMNRLPSAALGTMGGGWVLADPSDAEGMTALEPVFVFDIALPEDMAGAPFGTTARVRFDLGHEPALQQGMRRLRQMFLKVFDA